MTPAIFQLITYSFTLFIVFTLWMQPAIQERTNFLLSWGPTVVALTLSATFAILFGADYRQSKHQENPCAPSTTEQTLLHQE